MRWCCRSEQRWSKVEHISLPQFPSFSFPILSCLVSQCESRPLEANLVHLLKSIYCARLWIGWIVQTSRLSWVSFKGRISEAVLTATAVCALGMPEGSWSFGNLGYTVSFPPPRWVSPESSSGSDRFPHLPVDQPRWWGTETARCSASYPAAPSTAPRNLFWVVGPE